MDKTLDVEWDDWVRKYLESKEIYYEEMSSDVSTLAPRVLDFLDFSFCILYSC